MRGEAAKRTLEIGAGVEPHAAGVRARYVEERFGTPAFARTIVLPRSLPATAPEAARSPRRTVRELARTILPAAAAADIGDPAPPAPATPEKAQLGADSRSCTELSTNSLRTPTIRRVPARPTVR